MKGPTERSHRDDARAAGGEDGSGVGLVALDLDGVVYRGAAVLPGAVAAVKAVDAAGLVLRYVTNNSTLHRSDVAEKLRGMGVPAQPDQILTSAAATATWLADRLPAGDPLLVVGEAGLLAELEDAGFRPRHATTAADGDLAAVSAVVVGLDRSFDYAALARAQQVLLRDGLFVATNGDTTYPAEDGIQPGAGAIVAAVAAAGGSEPIVIGKPHVGLAEALRLSSGVEPARTVFVGDRLETDIAFGERAGMRSVLVLTGVTRREDLAESSVLPDYVLEGLEEFPPLLDELRRGA